jgi:uncharacterized membrane protein (DUF485 family)
VEEAYNKIASSAQFNELVRKRNRFAFTLSAIILIVYYAFVLFAATSGSGFATPVAQGSAVVIGLLIGWGIQIFSFLMTGVYVNRANSTFDAMTRAAVREAGL